MLMKAVAIVRSGPKAEAETVPEIMDEPKDHMVAEPNPSGSMPDTCVLKTFLSTHILFSCWELVSVTNSLWKLEDAGIVPLNDVFSKFLYTTHIYAGLDSGAQ